MKALYGCILSILLLIGNPCLGQLNYNTNIYENNKQNAFWNKPFVQIVLVPASFIATGIALSPFNHDVRNLRNTYIPQFHYEYDDYIQYTPAAAVFTLNLGNVKGRHSLARTTISYAISGAIAFALVHGIKNTAGVQRPDGSAHNSFPSGHTANAFMNATFMHKEYGYYNSLYSVAAYAIASATGIGRIMNNRHWISDVLAGVGIGILSTQIGYYISDKLYKDKKNKYEIKPAPAQTHISYRPLTSEIDMGILSLKENSYYTKYNKHWDHYYFTAEFNNRYLQNQKKIIFYKHSYNIKNPILKHIDYKKYSYIFIQQNYFLNIMQMHKRINNQTLKSFPVAQKIYPNILNIKPKM